MRSDPRFTCDDVLRIIANNLTDEEQLCVSSWILKKEFQNRTGQDPGFWTWERWLLAVERVEALFETLEKIFPALKLVMPIIKSFLDVLTMILIVLQNIWKETPE